MKEWSDVLAIKTVLWGVSNPNVMEIGPDALMNEAELANTIAHELNRARDFIRGGIAPEPSAHSAGNALSDYMNGDFLRL